MVATDAELRAKCRDCGLPYREMGVDLVLPDQQWNRLCPEGGILCANCVCKRAAKFGGTSILAWINHFNYHLNHTRQKRKSFLQRLFGGRK